MNKALPWVIVLALVAVAAAWYWNRQQTESAIGNEAGPAIVQPSARIEPEPEPVIEHPVEDIVVDPEPESEFFTPEPQPEALPSLANSDPWALESLSELFGPVALGPFLVPEAIIPRVVATIDNLPNSEIAPQISPVQPVEGELAVIEAGTRPAENPEDPPVDLFRLTPQNEERYAAMIELAESVDTDALVASYVSSYSLFQESYEQLGYPDGYFNDRLVAVIEHLLDSPEIHEPITLVQPEAFYEFTDPELEAMSAGHKIMVRMGPGNAARVKARLRAILYALTASPPAT